MAADKTTSQAAELPPLRIHHFMLLAAFIALEFVRDDGRSFHGSHFLPIVSFLSDPIVRSMCILALGTGIVGLFRGCKFFQEPGQWLLVPFACEWTSGWITFLTVKLLFNQLLKDLLFSHCLSIDIVCATFVPGIVLLFAAKRVRAKRVWKVVLAISACWLFHDCLHSIRVHLGLEYWYYASYGTRSFNLQWLANRFAFPVAGLAALLVAMISDFREQERHHWTHWCGAIAWSAVSVIAITRRFWEDFVKFPIA